MTILKTIKLFEFKDLDSEVKKSIIDDYMQDLPEWWSDDVEERIKNEAQAIGIKEFDFMWSGFCSEGDGLSFTGSLKFKTWLYILQEMFPEWSEISAGEETDGFRVLGKTIHQIIQLQKNDRILWGDCKIHRHSYDYCHGGNVNVLKPESEVRINLNSIREINHDFLYRVSICLNTWKDDLCVRWYNDLQEAYETVIDRDNITEDIESKEIFFTSSGTIITPDEISV